MIVNAPTVVATLVAVLQGLLAIAVLVTAVAALRARGAARTTQNTLGRDTAEVHALRPALPALALAVAALVSWPLLIAVLRSYVPEWTSVMCIDGVTRVGEGAPGWAGAMPTLISVLLATKPLLFFVGGAWLVAHLVSRARSAPPSSLAPALMVALGAVALVDAACSNAYFWTPKQAATLSAGCCATAAAVVPETTGSWLEIAGAGLSPLLAVALLVAAGLGAVLPLARTAFARRRVGISRATAVALVVSACVVAIAAQHLVVGVASPLVHGVDAHRCGWCVVEQTTFGGPFVATLFVGVAAAVLAAVAGALEHKSGDDGPMTSRRISHIALVAAAAATVLGAAFVVTDTPRAADDTHVAAGPISDIGTSIGTVTSTGTGTGTEAH